MAESGENIVLDENTGQLVFTVETVYLFPETAKSENKPSLADDKTQNVIEDKKTTTDVIVTSQDVGSVDDKASSDKDSGLVDVKSLPDVQQDTLDSDDKENLNTLSKSEASSSAYSTPKTRGPSSWAGPRPWMVSGKEKSEVLPLNKESKVPQSAPLAGRPATPPVNVKSPRIRSAPQSPTGRYPWTSVLRNRSGSTGKSPREYIEKPIPIDFEDDSDDDKDKREPKKENVRKETCSARGFKRPLVRLFPKPTSVPGQGEKVSKKGQGQGQYEAFDSASWSHVASEEDFEFFPPPPDLEHASASDLKHDVTLASQPDDLQLSTRTDHSTTKHSKHVTDSSSAETETTTNVTSDHTITFDPSNGTTTKTFTEHVEEITTLTATITTDSRALESTGGRLRSSSLVKEFLDELEFGTRKRSYSFPEKDATKPNKSQLSVPGTLRSARSPQTPDSDIIEFACGVKFEKHSPSPRFSPDFRPHDTQLKFEENQTKETAKPEDPTSKFDTDAVAPREPKVTPEVNLSNATSPRQNQNQDQEPKDKLEKDHKKKDVLSLHVDENMSLEDMLESLKTYLSSENLLDGPSKPVEEEIKLKYEESHIYETSSSLVETERSEEIYVGTGTPKVLRTEPELERTLETIRGMLSSSTEFLEYDVDIEDLPSPFDKTEKDENKTTYPEKDDVEHLNYTTVFVELLNSMKEVLQRTTDETDLRARPKRQMSKLESEFEDTLNTVREFLASDAEILDEDTSDEDEELYDDSDIEMALESVREAIDFSSDYDSDYDNKVPKRQWRPIPTQQSTSYQTSVDVQSTSEIPFQRYVYFESKVSDPEINRAHTIDWEGNVTLPDQLTTSEHTKPDLPTSDKHPHSNGLNPSEMDNVDFGCLSPDDTDNERDFKEERTVRPYEQQLSTEFTPNLLEMQAVEIDIDEENIHVIENMETKDRSGSSGSSSGSIDFKDPPRDCSSPHGDTGVTEALYSKPLKKPKIQVNDDKTGSTKPEPKVQELDYDPGCETIKDDVAVELNFKNEMGRDYDPDYESIKDDSDDVGEQDTDLRVGVCSKSSSESSMNEPDFMFDDDSSTLSILSDIGNTQSDFGSTEYLYVDLECEITDEGKEQDERRKELENQFQIQREVESMLEDFERQQEIVRMEEKELMAKFDGETSVVQEEVCEEVVVRNTVAQGSFDILENIRNKHEHNEMSEKDVATNKFDVLNIEESVVTENSTQQSHSETLEEIMARLEGQIVEVDDIEKYKRNESMGEKTTQSMSSDKISPNTKEDRSDESDGTKEDGSYVSADESSRSLDDELHPVVEYSILDTDKGSDEEELDPALRELDRHVLETGIDPEEEKARKGADSNQNIETYLDREVQKARKDAMIKLEDLLRFDTPEKSDTSARQSSESSPERDDGTTGTNANDNLLNFNSRDKQGSSNSDSDSDSEENEETFVKFKEKQTALTVSKDIDNLKEDRVSQHIFETGHGNGSSENSLDKIVERNNFSHRTELYSRKDDKKGMNGSPTRESRNSDELVSSPGEERQSRKEKTDEISDMKSQGNISAGDADDDDIFAATSDGNEQGDTSMGEEPLPTSDRADRLSLHRDDSFHSFENQLEAISAENLSSTSGSNSSLDEIGATSELRIKRRKFGRGKVNQGWRSHTGASKNEPNTGDTRWFQVQILAKALQGNEGSKERRSQV